MSENRRKWSISEKLEILQYYKIHGLSRTVREFHVSSTAVYKWQNILDDHGPEGLENKHRIKGNAELDRLRRENRELKAIVAEKELALRIKTELLKKSL